MSYTEQLERDTERTRLELANTIEELRERLTPGEVLDEVLDYASDGDVGDYLRSLKRQIIDNPLPLGLMGVSAAWLIAASAFGRRANGRMMRERAARNASDLTATAQARAGDVADRAQAAGAALGESARAAAGDMADSARRTAHDLRDTAHDWRDQAAQFGTDATDRAAAAAQDARAMATRLGDRARDAASAAGASIADTANRSAEAIGETASALGRNSQAASRAISDFAREQPLIVAAAGVVLGAIIGALLPSTEIEDRLVGESSDAAKERLRAMAGEQYAKAKDVAAQAAEAALDATGVKDAAPHDGADQQKAHEFGPGPGTGYSADSEHVRDRDSEHASGEHSSDAEAAEHTHADGG